MQTVSELVRARADDSAQRVFCSFEGQATTFEQLHRGVQEVAGALIEVGARPGDRIGLMVGKSVDHIKLYLAIPWLGAIAVPFSIHLKAAGVELQLGSCTPAIMVANRVHADTLRQALQASAQRSIIVWLEDGECRPGEVNLNELLRISRAARVAVVRDPLDAVEIMYTSGTTGAPKGGVRSERFTWIATKNAAIITDAQPDDVYLLWEPFYHGAAWRVVMMALYKSFRIHMVDRFSASRLWDQVAESSTTKLHYLGGLVNIMMAQPQVASERDNTVSIAWGAACPADTWRQFEDRFGLRVREGYGLTEGQSFTHMNLTGLVGSVGKPIEELESWIADEQGQRVGPGVVGEIVLKASEPGVSMTGYWGAPERTAEVLRDGCVYTGDLGAMDDDGNFYFKGRKKDAMRRRGENVSAWEVERVVNAAPAVEESAVIGVEVPLGEQEILAVVKLREGTEPDPLAIHGFCADRLAYYQVPRFFVFVDEFPRGPTQRIMKKHIQVDLGEAWDAEKAGIKLKRTVA